MVFPGIKKTNNLAIAGFLFPFMAAGLVSGLVLYNWKHSLPFPIRIPFITLIPLILIGGLIFSIKSIPMIDKRGDKDYAYSGLVLNIFFILLYIASLIYCLCLPS